MFRVILYTQWKWGRFVLLFAVIAAFAVPVLSVQQTGSALVNIWATRDMLSHLDTYGALYPILAGALALFVALAAWEPDQRGRHVYALSLPVPRWHYALLRFGAGALLLALPVFALWIGALVAASVTTLPQGLHAYPTALAVRFALAVAVAYSMFFAISSGTKRTAGILLGALGALIVVQVALSLTGSDVNILYWMIDRLFTAPGPFDIFTGHWMLIDV